MNVVNGYYCRTCSDESLAKRNIDPARPKDGPFGRDAPEAKARAAAHQAAITGGPRPPSGQGLHLDLSV